MDWISTLITALATIVGSVLTYKATKNSKEKEIESLKETHKHELDKLEYEKEKEIALLKAKNETQLDYEKNKSSNDLENKFLERFLEGNLDFDNLSNQYDKLNRFNDKVNN